MQTPNAKAAEGCQGGCPTCPMNDPAPEEGLAGWTAAHDAAAADSLGGAALVFRALTAFLLPVASAAAGAVLASDGRSEARAFLGLVIGLACGMAIAKIIFFFLPAANRVKAAGRADQP